MMAGSTSTAALWIPRSSSSSPSYVSCVHMGVTRSTCAQPTRPWHPAQPRAALHYRASAGPSSMQGNCTGVACPGQRMPRGSHATLPGRTLRSDEHHHRNGRVRELHGGAKQGTPPRPEQMRFLSKSDTSWPGEVRWRARNSTESAGKRGGAGSSPDWTSEGSGNVHEFRCF